MKYRTLALAAVLALPLTACSSGDDTPAPKQVVPSVTTTQSPNVTPLPSYTVQSVFNFGQTKTYKIDSDLDGVQESSDTDTLQVTVSAPEPFTPNKYAADEPAAHYIKFHVTLHNLSADLFDPSGFTSSLQSGGVEGTSVWDSSAGLGGGPSTSILPGDTVTFDVGYGVADPTAVVLQLSPSYDFNPTIFTNKTQVVP